MDQRERIDRLPPLLSGRLRQVVDEALDHVFTACSLFVHYRGEIVYNEGQGWIDPSTRHHPVNPASRFDLASLTKLYAATAFLSLVSAGRVGLDDSLVSIVPEFGASGPRLMDGGQDPFTRALLSRPLGYAAQAVDPAHVTFRQILTHKAGLAPWRAIFLESGPVPLPPHLPDPVDHSTRWNKGLQAIYRYPFVDLPGKQVHYSDLGFILLGEALARLSGGTVDAAIQAWVLNPLALTSTVYNPLCHGWPREDIVPTEDDCSWRCRRLWGEVDDENAAGLGGISGHAGLFASAWDVGMLGLAWLTRSARLGIAPGIIEEAVAEQVRDGAQRRGLGWQLLPAAAAQDVRSSVRLPLSPGAFGHTGFTGTSLWIDPQRELVVICLTNRVYFGREQSGIEQFRVRVHQIIAEQLT